MDTYEGKDVFLQDLILRDDAPQIIHDCTFVDCNVYGPVVLYNQKDVTYLNCNIGTDNNDIEEALFEVPKGSIKLGLTGINRCSFIKCKLFNIGFAGTKEELNVIRKNVQ